MLNKKPVRSKRLRDSACGQQCTVNVAGVCNYNNETTVLAHYNFDGGTMGGKSDDTSAGFCCSECHAHLDQNKLSIDSALFYKARSMVRTMRIWIDGGLVSVK